MAIVLNNITSGYNLAKINANFQNIEDYINDKLLARADTGVAGEAMMERDLDMNGNEILNYPVDVTNPNSLVTKAYVDAGDANLQLQVNKSLRFTDNIPVANYGAIGRANSLQGYDSLGKPVPIFSMTDTADLAIQLASHSQGLGAALIGNEGNGTVADVIGWMVTPEEYYTTGETDHTSALSQALDAAISTGKVLVCDPSVEYNITSVIQKNLTEGQTLQVEFNGAKFRQAQNNTLLVFQNTLNGSVASVTSLTEESYNLSVTASTNSRVTKITAPGHPFTDVGQVGKIFSDDVVADNDAASQFKGEWFTVGAISGDDIYTTGVLIESYTTNPKVCRPSNARLKLSNFRAVSTWDNAINAAAITVRGFVIPTMAGSWVAEDINATFLSVTSCYMADVSATIIGKRVKNLPATSAFGYLFNDSASYGTQVYSINGQYTRHAFTTTTPNSTANDDRWDLRGRSMYPKVVNCIVQANACGIDTHSPAYQPHFGTITALDDYRGDGAGGVALQIRANSSRIDTLEAVNPKVGLFFSGASKTSPSLTSIGNIRITTRQGSLPLRINGASGYLNKVVIDSFDCDTTHDSMVSITSSNVIIKYLNGNFSPYQNGGELFELNTGAILDVLDGDVYINTGSRHRLAVHTDTDTVCRAKMRVTGMAAVSYLAASASQYDIQSEWDVHVDAWTGTPFLGLPATGAKPFAKIRVGSAQYPLKYRAISYGTAGNKDIDLANAGDPVVFLRITASIAGVAVNTITKGAFPGQLLMINNHTSSASTVAINNNSRGLLSLGSSRTLAIGAGTCLAWDGSTWRLAAS